VQSIKTFNNGVFIGQNYSSIKSDIKTYSYWPSPGSRSDNDNDKNFVIDVINKGSISVILPNGDNFALRRLKITDASVGVINTKAYASNITGCSEYGPGFIYSFCTCVDESTRLWKNVSSEDYTPEGFFGPRLPSSEVSPNVAVNKINAANNSSQKNGFANNGQTKNVQ
jgi:hypothetical protein